MRMDRDVRSDGPTISGIVGRGFKVDQGVFEGLAITREHGQTIVWLVADDNLLPLQRSLLLKFRLNPDAPRKAARR